VHSFQTDDDPMREMVQRNGSTKRENKHREPSGMSQWRGVERSVRVGKVSQKQYWKYKKCGVQILEIKKHWWEKSRWLEPQT